MAISIGIDLGTTNSVVSYWNRGKVETINIDSRPTFPSVISYKDGQIISGYQAKSRLLLDPNNSVSSSKREIGNKNASYTIGGKNITPTDVAYEILKAIKEKVEYNLGESISSAVVTVPAYFTSEQREATLEAAKRAGLNVLRLVPEPTAAAISYGLNQCKDQTIMVYDLGGGTFDISILKVRGNDFEVLAVDGDSRLGGDDFDNVILNYLYDVVREELGINISLKKDRKYMEAKQKMKEACEKAKIELSDAEYTDILIPNLIDDYCLDVELNRESYYKMIEPILNKTIDKMKSVLNYAKLSNDDIDRVILVGGSTKSPIIKELVKREIKDPFVAPNVDEVVSHGAAILAFNLDTPDDMLNANTPNIKVTEKIVHSYGIDLLNSKDELYYSVLLKKGMEIPISKCVLTYTSTPFQERTVMNVIRGEYYNDLDNNEKLGKLEINISKPNINHIPFGTIFEIDENMIIHFTNIELGYKNPITQDLVSNAKRDLLSKELPTLDIDEIRNLIDKNLVNYKYLKIEG